MLERLNDGAGHGNAEAPLFDASELQVGASFFEMGANQDTVKPKWELDWEESAQGKAKSNCPMSQNERFDRLQGNPILDRITYNDGYPRCAHVVPDVAGPDGKLYDVVIDMTGKRTIEQCGRRVSLSAHDERAILSGAEIKQNQIYRREYAALSTEDRQLATRMALAIESGDRLKVIDVLYDIGKDHRDRVLRAARNILIGGMFPGRKSLHEGAPDDIRIYYQADDGISPKIIVVEMRNGRLKKEKIHDVDINPRVVPERR